MVLKNPGIIGFVADAEMRVRAGLQPRPDGGMNLVGRRPGATAEEWEVFLDVDSDDALGTAPIGFTADGNSLYLLSSVDANASRLLRVDLAPRGRRVWPRTRSTTSAASCRTPTPKRSRWCRSPRPGPSTS